jgi:hypothetical protein
LEEEEEEEEEDMFGMFNLTCCEVAGLILACSLSQRHH